MAIPTDRSSRFLRAAENAVVISAAAPTSETTMKPTKAFDIPKARAACWTDPTKISDTSAIRIVATARAPRAAGSGQGFSSCSASPTLWKYSLCVLRENNREIAYVPSRMNDSRTESGFIRAGTLSLSTLATTEGISRAIVARSSIPACTREFRGLNSCTR